MSKEKTIAEFEQSYLSQPCPDCSNPMSAEEAYYYEKCEICETEKWRELRLWKSGTKNPEFDEKFSLKKEVKH